MACHEELDVERDDGSLRSLSVDASRWEASVHGRLEMGCTDCHADIDDIPHPEKLAKVDCGGCHGDAAEAYAASVHGQSYREGAGGGGADCAACHGTHDILHVSEPDSKVHRSNLAQTCVECHEDEALILEHDLPSVERIQSYVFSVHGQSNLKDPDSSAATCNDCHGWHDIQANGSGGSKVSRSNVAKTCGRCHADVVDAYYQSVHGRLAREGNPDVAVCTDCHGEHRIHSPEDRQSTVSRYRIAETCARCHEDPEIIEKYRIPIASPSTFYRQSIHGEALLSGRNEEAAACQDCHGYHSILGGHDPRSSVNRMRIMDTCGHCHRHEEIRKEYEQSVHGQALLQGVDEAPVCTDCHGEHTILSHLDPNSPVYPIRLSKEVCGRCHDSLVINRKYGLPPGQVKTYLESYHGLASRLGDTTVANCASCHGVHGIFPSSDSRSSIYPENLQATCGKCHPGASKQFVAGLVHISSSRSKDQVIYWVRLAYLLLIGLTIGGMLMHNLLIVYRHVRDKYREQESIPYVVRFPMPALVQHLLLTVFFIVLVISGFSLSFPESLFSQIMGHHLGLGEKARSTVHRIAGVGLALTMLWHLASMLFTRRGRRELGALMFRLRDIKDTLHNVGFHLGLRKTGPRFDRYDYSEKMEYWALLWGTLIMVATGLMMWFPTKVASFLGLSRLWVDVATVIHYYEAWLATLAILIWHFFFVIFHPEEYPMALSWLTGKLSVKAMEERHPEELERLQASGEIHRPGQGDFQGHGPKSQ